MIEPAPRAIRFLKLVGPLGVYIALAFIAFSSAWRDPRHLTIGVPGDPFQTMWLLGWPTFALRHGLNPFISTYMYWPGGINLLWTPTTYLPALLVTPVYQMFGPPVAFDLLMTLSVAFSAWVAYLAIRRLVPYMVAAFLGGLLYGFSPSVFAAASGHLHLVMAWFPPLAFLLLHELVVRRRWPWLVTGGLLGLAAGIQFYTSSEILFTTAMLSMVGLAVLGILAWREKRQLQQALTRIVQGGSVGLVVGLLIAAPGIATMYFGPDATTGDLQPLDVYVTDLASLVLPDTLIRLTAAPVVKLTARFTGWPGEWMGYVGIPLLLLLGWSIWRWRRRLLVRWTAIVASIVVILSFGPHLHVLGHVTRIILPWRLLDLFQTFHNVLPSRLMMYFFLGAGILVAMLVERVAAGDPRNPAARVALMAWLLVSLITIAPTYPWLATSATVPVFFTDGSVDRIPQGSVALLLPFVDVRHPVGLFWQAASGYRFRMPEGYGAHPTKGLIFDPSPSVMMSVSDAIASGQVAPKRTIQLRRELSCELARWQVRTVILGPQIGQGQARSLMTWVTGEQPQYEGGVWVWWHVNPSCRGG